MEAKIRIQKAIQHKQTRLDLSGLNLTELPDSIKDERLSHVKELYLNNNRLRTLESLTPNLAGLHRLEVKNNGLEEIPDFLDLFPDLQSLVLFENYLRGLPSSIGKLKKLKNLNLANNHIEKLPTQFGSLKSLKWLNLYHNRLSSIPKSLGRLRALEELKLNHNKLDEVPEAIQNQGALRRLLLCHNKLTRVPVWIDRLGNLRELDLSQNKLNSLPKSIENLRDLQTLNLYGNHFKDIPLNIVAMDQLQDLDMGFNQLSPEMMAVSREGLRSLRTYVRVKEEAGHALHEAKLILVGEGEVGKTCLMDALQGKPFIEHQSTHGINISSFQVNDPKSNKKITLNGWDFGGQPVYKPTHQLFFSSPAVYLVVWKPREGLSQGLVKEWIKLIKYREPKAKILVVATHCGPGHRQPDINEQEIIDEFGEDMILGFHEINSKPDDYGIRYNIEALKEDVARIAMSLPEVGQEVAKSFHLIRQQLQKMDKAYIRLEEISKICSTHHLDEEKTQLFLRISHQMGHLIHYENDPELHSYIILKPDWLATAISFVLDDQETRENNGLVTFDRLHDLWDNHNRLAGERYPAELHHIFLRLMERFDLSYKVHGIGRKGGPPISLIAQLVPDKRPEKSIKKAWPSSLPKGDLELVQVCRIRENTSKESATAEGLFFKLIVRLHRFSMGRLNYKESIHWQKGLILDDAYNGRALLEQIGSNIRITVRAPYPERFLSRLTGEIQALVEEFWEGLKCEVMVPCINESEEGEDCIGLFDVEKLVSSKKMGRPEYPCDHCGTWGAIDTLLRNAPYIHEHPAEQILYNKEVESYLKLICEKLIKQERKQEERHTEAIGRFNKLEAEQRKVLSKTEASFDSLMSALISDARKGPRLFSLIPLEPNTFDPKSWISHKFKLTLWCEYAKLPLPVIYQNNGEKDSQRGSYVIELRKEWFREVAPFLRKVTGYLKLFFPIAVLNFDSLSFLNGDLPYKSVEEHLDLGEKVFGQIDKGELIASDAMLHDEISHNGEKAIIAESGMLRQLHALLEQKDASFGGLVKVRNKRDDIMWVHPIYKGKF